MERTRREADTNEELCARWQRDRDPAMLAQLVENNLGLVRKIARECNQIKHVEDLEQEGALGLLDGLGKWDASRGVKVSTYVVWWIRAYQKLYLLKQHRTVVYGTTAAQRKLYYGLPKISARLEASGVGASAENVAKVLNLDLKRDRVEEAMGRLARGDKTLDLGDEQDHPLVPSAEANCEATELLKLLSEEVLKHRGGLHKREREIFDERFFGEDRPTLLDLSKRFGVSRERVRQIEKRSFEALKERVLARIG